MEETKTIETKTQSNGSGGKIVGFIAIIIAVIALVLALSNLGVKSELKEVKKFTNTLASKEAALETKAVQLEAVNTVERIYILTMVEKNYDAAKAELAKAEKLFAELKKGMSEEQAKKVDETLAALKAEIEKGPSPIPALVAELTKSAFEVKAAVEVKPVTEKVEAEKEAQEKVEKPAEKKVELKKAPAVAKSAQEEEKSSLKKTYLFWKKLGESLVKK
ncbi:hypothetical protein TST_0923 [Thermosulfidibacter takaii ABI70S6]|uniref:Uncharacterized protein n=1 Tax=Thermosulfidibacter takaii (strain DSM 17441 / JCM 13301 / NBRC 103674 / ABI70S6) TaxID=1298851 RepID=A0A0S3QTQ9_THET7|nr:hypothetical protein [Thermosulfidibacter takaii]BAT71723.1 hypothetical protein TST_0923 [Thermosulfidibacter takaii ABI70S6]